VHIKIFSAVYISCAVVKWHDSILGIPFLKLQTQPFYGCLDFVRDNLDELVPKETFTHSRLSWSSVILYLLPPSVAIHSILPVQFTCLTVFFPQSHSKFSLVYLLAWHPPSIHFFTQSLSSFCSTCPYHCNLFCWNTEFMSSNPSLSLNPLLGTLSCSLTPHIYLTIQCLIFIVYFSSPVFKS